MKKLGKLSLSEMKKEMSTLERKETGRFRGGTSTDSQGNTVYSSTEFGSQLTDGSWEGGYVTTDGVTKYVPAPTVIYSASYSGLSAYDYAQTQSYANHAAAQVIALIPFLAQMTQLVAAQHNDAAWLLSGDLIKAGYTNQPLFFKDEVDAVDGKEYLRMYNASGQIIGSEEVKLSNPK